MFSAETVNLVTRIARNAKVEPAALLAVIEVESGGKAHAMVRGRKEPLIRFEGHYFDRRLSPPDRERARREGLASPTPGTVRNPPNQAARWRLLEQAAEINRQAAYESTSWGVGQVMGAHWAWLGYAGIDALVAEARSGLEGQLGLMMRYIERGGLLETLRRLDWSAFARGYNGFGYARSSYHLRLSLACRRHRRNIAAAEKGESPGLLQPVDRYQATRHLQRLLGANGYPVAIDGIFGPRSRQAVFRFQRDHGFEADGIAGPQTLRALEDALPGNGVTRLLRQAIGKLWRRIPNRLMHRNV